MSRKVLISSLWKYEYFIEFWKANLKEKPDKIYFIIDIQIKPEQKRSIKEIEKTFSKRIFDYEFLKWPLDPVNNCIQCLTLIKKHKDDEIMIDLTGGLKPRCFGMNYAGFNQENVTKICYYDYTTKTIVVLPKLKIRLTKNQKKLLKFFKDKKPSDNYTKSSLSSSSYYYQRKKLNEIGYLNSDKITDAGKIALLIAK